MAKYIKLLSGKAKTYKEFFTEIPEITNEADKSILNQEQKLESILNTVASIELTSTPLNIISISSNDTESEEKREQELAKEQEQVEKKKQQMEATAEAELNRRKEQEQKEKREQKEKLEKRRREREDERMEKYTRKNSPFR